MQTGGHFPDLSWSPGEVRPDMRVEHGGPDSEDPSREGAGGSPRQAALGVSRAHFVQGFNPLFKV